MQLMLCSRMLLGPLRNCLSNSCPAKLGGIFDGQALKTNRALWRSTVPDSAMRIFDPTLPAENMNILSFKKSDGF